jgi:hypothetical protein
VAGGRLLQVHRLGGDLNGEDVGRGCARARVRICGMHRGGLSREGMLKHPLPLAGCGKEKRHAGVVSWECCDALDGRQLNWLRAGARGRWLRKAEAEMLGLMALREKVNNNVGRGAGYSILLVLGGTVGKHCRPAASVGTLAVGIAGQQSEAKRSGAKLGPYWLASH